MEIISKSIQELTFVPELKMDTEFAVQRIGVRTAEKTNVAGLSTLLALEGSLKDTIMTQVNSNISMGIRDHAAARDPHGDRLYADSLVRSHLSQLDPHGDRNFTTAQINLHSNGSDPHGDRFYSDSKLDSHIKGSDPHGDRAYSESKLAEHLNDIDPHNIKLNTSIAINDHSSSNDPHGDRLYANTKLVEHNLDKNAHGIADIVREALKQHDEDETSHRMGERLKIIDASVESKVAQTFSQQVGVTVPTLEGGSIPDRFLKPIVVIGDSVTIPRIGLPNTLYVNKVDKSISIWDNSKYESITGNSKDIILTTDDVAEGARADRKYFTKDLKDTYDKKIGEVESVYDGVSLYSPTLTTDGKLFLKNIQSEGDVRIEDNGEILTLKNDNYRFEARFDKDVELTSPSTILNEVTDKDVVSLVGTVTAKEIEQASGKLITNSLSMWEVKAVLGNQGTITSIKKPSNVAIATNGLIVSGLSVATCTVEAYNETNTLIGSTSTQVDGTFTITLSSAKLDGSLIRLYTVTPEGERSEPLDFYSTNRSYVKPFEALSFNKEGTRLRGNTSRGVKITVSNAQGTEIGAATSNSFGNFEVTLSSSVISNDILTVVGKVDNDTYTLNEMIVNLKDIVNPYNIEYNRERTVVQGMAEPNSLVTISYGLIEHKVGSDSTGKWTLYSFSNPISTLGTIRFNVTQEERTGTIELSFTEEYSNPETLPKVNNKITSSEMNFIVKEINPLITGTDPLTFDIVYDKVTQKLKLVGGNKSTKNVDWKGSFTIIKDTI